MEKKRFHLDNLTYIVYIVLILLAGSLIINFSEYTGYSIFQKEINLFEKASTNPLETITGNFIFGAKADTDLNITLTLNGTEGNDTYIWQQFPTLNFDNPSNPAYHVMHLGIAGGFPSRILIRFNLSALNSSVTINNATLGLFVNFSSNNIDMPAYIYRATSDWKENETTWNRTSIATAWTTNGGDYGSRIFNSTVLNGSTTGYFNFDITSLLRYWVNGSYTNYGLFILSDETTNEYKDIISSDVSNFSQRPFLNVSYSKNAAPYTNTLSDNSPKPPGSNITFTLNWTDIDSSTARIFICSNASANSSNGCLETTYCNTTLSATNPQLCNYTAQLSDPNNNTYYGFVCDTSGRCSDSTLKYDFEVNKAPVANGTIPNQTWSEDNNLTNTFDLNNYFNDSDSTTFNFTYDGNTNITITVVSGVVSFNPNKDWHGTELVNFTISDGYSNTTSGLVNLTIKNEAPNITLLQDNSDSSTYILVGDSLKINVTFTDSNDLVRLFVCSNSSIDYSGCKENNLCNTSLNTTNPVSCLYTILSTDNKPYTNYSTSVCDDSENCSSVSIGGFYPNNLPNISVIYPNGGETINTNFSITFNTSDIDEHNLTASIYYSNTTSYPEITIISNLSLDSNYCTDLDNNRSTTNNCSYLWESINLFGSYYVIVIINDSRTINNDSNDAPFNLNTLKDYDSPFILNEKVTSSLTSGELAEISSYINDSYLNTTWFTINDSANLKTNYTMANIGTNNYSTSFKAGNIGVYKYKVFANDSSGNINNTRDWNEFTVSAPTATVQNEKIPATSLPAHMIKIYSELSATDLLAGLNATLNSNTNFTYPSYGSSQTQSLGNISAGSVANSSWYLTVPYDDGTYILNVTYRDNNNNSWQGSNLSISVSSSVGTNGTFVEISPYPEVLAGNNFSAQISIKNGDGNYITPDSLCVSLIDSLSNKIVDCSPTTLVDTGRYSITYTTAAGLNQGQWEVNTTIVKSGNSYYARHYWYLVGGPFDVRNIIANNLVIPSLSFTVTTENTGNVGQDLTLVWNLTRLDTGALLDSGADTFLVPASSTKDWTISPSTTYIGNVRVTMMGYYSGTEKAGAFANFVTTETSVQPGSGPGGGGATGAGILRKNVPMSNIELIDIISDLSLDAGKTRTVELSFANRGLTNLNNVILEIIGINKNLYEINPKTFSTISPNELKIFIVKFNIPQNEPESKYSFIYTVKADESSVSEAANLIIFSLRSNILNKISELKRDLINLKFTLSKVDKTIKEVSKAETLISLIEEKLSKAEAILGIDLQESSQYTNEAELYIIRTKEELENAGIKIKDYQELPLRIKFPWIFWVLMALLIVLIIMIVIIAIVAYKRISIIKLLNTKRSPPSAYASEEAPTRFEEELKRLERELFRKE